jgi:hypothetical protein
MKTTATMISVVLVLPVAAYAFAVHLDYGWDAGDLDIERIGAFDLVGVEGCVYDRNTVGTVCDLRLLPHGCAVDSYEIISEHWEPIERAFTLGTDPGDGMVRMTADQAGGVRGVISGNLLGYTVLVARISPIRVVAGRVSLLRDLRLRVNLRDENPDIRVRRRSSVATAHAEDLLRRLIRGEPAAYRSWNVVEDYDLVSPGPSLDGGVVDCVIITDEDLAPEFERLAGFHNRLGIRTVVRTTGWIESNYEGSDSPERIRNFIRHAYENWGTVYILLGGDPQVVPIRVLDYPLMISTPGISEIASDVYYTNLEGNWNADGDEVIGEFGPEAMDEVDRFPDIFAGRAAASTVDEARLFVDKTIHYMSGANPGVWHRRSVFLAQQIQDQLDGATASERILSHFPEHFEKIRLYENYELYPGALEETVENAIAYIDSGCNLVSHIGHGDEFRLDLGTDYMERMEIESLRSDTSYCFVYMMNCSSADPRVESVAKAFLKNPHGGAFAVLGNSELAYPGTGLRMEEDFFEYVFCEGRPTIGAISGTYRVPYLFPNPYDLAKWWMYLNYILLGDPVVHLWTDEPGILEVTLGGSLSLGDSVYTVEVEDGGVGLEGAVVVLIGERGEYGVGVSGVDGIADVSYRPKGLGWVDVIVSHAGYIAHEDSVEVSGSGGRLYVSGVEVDDGGGWIGNGDGEVGWGERVGLGVGLTNGGVGVLSEVVGSLRVVEGCSLWVSVAIDDSVRSDSVVYVGSGGVHPGSMPFGLGIEDWVFGRYLSSPGHELGCWLWLDWQGWHVRFLGDRDYHSYACSLTVYGELLGYSGHGLESGDSVLYSGGDFVFAGTLGVGDFEDGLDLVLGNDVGVSVYDGTASYGSVGSSEVLGWYDVGFEGGFGDELGVWFEVELSSGGGGLWRDWFMVLAHDGSVLGERLELSALSGDTLGVVYGLRNAGSGGLRGLEGRLRGLSGVEVCDSVSAYGDVASMAYVEGDGYKVRELGGVVRYEFELRDIYGRSWYDTVEVRGVSGVSGVEGLSGGDYIELSWSASGDSLLWGYDIYRSDSYGGPYELAGLTEGHSRYVDGGLLSEARYYYYVQARDAMGNLSVPSETLEIWTGPPYMPGWPAELRGVSPSSPVSGDADHDGLPEVFIGTKGLEVAGLDQSGNALPGYPYEGRCEVWSSPVLVDLDGNETLECVFGEGTANTGQHCARVVALNHDGTFVTPENNPELPAGGPGWPQTVAGRIRPAPAVYDLDGDGRPEILIGIEQTGYVYAFRHDGSPYLEGSAIFAETECGIWATPCIYDLDGDGMPEVIICDKSCGQPAAGGNVYIWRSDGTAYLPGSGGVVDSTGRSFMSSPVVGDIDGDGRPEIVAVNTYGNVLALNHDGTPVSGQGSIIADFHLQNQASPALADFDSDGKLEIVVGFAGQTPRLVLLRWDGSPYNQEPVILDWTFSLGHSSPVVADIDGDIELEIVVCSADGYVIALNPDGTFANGYPRKLDSPIFSSPLVDDLDRDGDMELVVGGYDSRLHVWDLSSPYLTERVPWGMYQHDRWHTGAYGFVAPTDTTAPTSVIAVFQNPVVGRVMDVFIMPRERITEPPDVVLASASGRDILDVDIVLEEPQIYRGHHVADPAAAETVYVTTEDVYGNQGMESRVITYARAVGGDLVVTSSDMVLQARASAGPDGFTLAVLPVDVEYLSGRGETDADPELEGAAYNVCIIGREAKRLVIDIDIGGADRTLYRYEDGWQAVPGQERLGSFVHLADAPPGIYAVGRVRPDRDERFTISRAAPNPFGDKCAIRLKAPQRSPTEVSVFDVQGRLVKTIFEGTVEGEVGITWDGTDRFGRRVSSGIYFIHVDAGPVKATRKTILVR